MPDPSRKELTSIAAKTAPILGVAIELRLHYVS
jgi:hypothetical protein